MLACLAVPGATAPGALADSCGVPDTTPLWVDFAGHDAPIPAKPGMVLAVASGTDTPSGDARARAPRPSSSTSTSTTGSARRPSPPTRDDRRQGEEASTTTPSRSRAAARRSSPRTSSSARRRRRRGRTRTRSTARTRSRCCRASPRSARGPRCLIANPPYTGGDAGDWWRAGREGRDPHPRRSTSPRRTRRGSTRSAPCARAATMRQSMRGPRQQVRGDRHPVEPDRARSSQFNSSPGLGRTRRAPAVVVVVRDREARGARGEAGRDRVQARRDLVVGLGDLQRRRRRP